MGNVNSEALAYHIGAVLDGDWDDGIEAFVAASANGNVLNIELSDDGGALIQKFKVTVEQVS